MRFYQTIKKVISGGSGNWLPRQNAGALLRSLLTWKQPQTVGIVVTGAPVRGVSLETVGLVATALMAGSAKPAQTAGVVQRVAPALLAKPSQIGGMQVVRHTFALTRRIGANSTVQTAITGSGWVNPNNANGIHQGVFAVMTGSAIAAQGGTLTLSYVDPDSTKSQLTIVSARLHLYFRVTGDTLSSSVITRAYRSTALTQVTLGTTLNGNRDNSVTPETFDITAAVAGNWSNLNGFQAIFAGSTPLANLSVLSLDAIELEIITAQLVT